ncbi:MAG: response regulator [Hirschia sp.]|nr:response regulator [Hirschia sp.]MBF19019.1 response regulator [Hirschia sp.]|tara:strand:- start:347 stop:733 length:387 start_codon:yes stop_codon:yes gene_type:complete
MHVLFVDDDTMNRRVVRDMLEIAGVKMDEAADGPSGLALIESADYALILMDLRMPGMDGLTAIKHIRERNDAKAALPILVVTADTSLDIRERCIANGADDLLQKPVAMNSLYEAMAMTIANRAQAKAS